MFDTVENNTTFTSEIVILLTRLISYEMVDVKVYNIITIFYITSLNCYFLFLSLEISNKKMLLLSIKIKHNF